MRANPAGNITLFVLSPVEKKDHASLAEKLMALEQFKAEQEAIAASRSQMWMATWKCPAESFAETRRGLMVCWWRSRRK